MFVIFYKVLINKKILTIEIIESVNTEDMGTLKSKNNNIILLFITIIDISFKKTIIYIT